MKIPYGRASIEINLADRNISVFTPLLYDYKSTDESQIVRIAFSNPLKGKNLDLSSKTKIGIGINDQSRPIPHIILLPELLKFLENKGAQRENITFYIATGTHAPVPRNNFSLIVNKEIIDNFRIVSHDCDDAGNLLKIGTSTRNTPILVNKSFFESEIKIVVGNIESHHFMGFSGGYKTASIGLASRETITSNHALLSTPNAKMGLFSSNPMRLEVEEIGKLIGVDFALNVVISPDKKILSCYWGSPEDVILEGIRFIRNNIQLDLGDVLGKFDLVITSPGGYPKDINFYQSQKAITHACLFAKPGGKIILAAECKQGFGSEKFKKFIALHDSIKQEIESFETQQFEIGPHKAYQLAKQASEYEITLVSNMSKRDVSLLKIKHESAINSAIQSALEELPPNPRIAILPYATHTMPQIVEK